MVKGRPKEAENSLIVNSISSKPVISRPLMARLMAGDSAYDIWNSQTRIGYYELVSQGAAYPMGDLLPEAFYKGLSHQEQQAVKILEFNGKIYGIGSTHWGGGMWNVGSMVTFYNKTLIDREGLPDRMLYTKKTNGPGNGVMKLSAKQPKTPMVTVKSINWYLPCPSVCPDGLEWWSDHPQ